MILVLVVHLCHLWFGLFLAVNDNIIRLLVKVKFNQICLFIYKIVWKVTTDSEKAIKTFFLLF